MKREKNTQRTFWDDVFLGVLIGTIAYSIVATFIVFDICKEVEYLSNSNLEKIEIISQKNDVIREKEEIILELEEKIEFLTKWTSLGVYKITYYCPCEDCSGEWGTSIARPCDGKHKAIENHTVAVDPSVIPYGTKIRIGDDPTVYIAEDCGGAVKGNTIDVFVSNHKEKRYFKEIYIKN